MWLWTLLEVASMPVLQVVFVAFTPCLVFASLSNTVTLEEIISWWYMPVNIGITFVFGGILGWILGKILKPKKHLEGLVIATCSAGNLGNMKLILIPAICDEKGSPFGEYAVCTDRGMAYASFSMAACLNLNQSC